MRGVFNGQRGNPGTGAQVEGGGEREGEWSEGRHVGGIDCCCCYYTRNLVILITVLYKRTGSGVATGYIYRVQYGAPLTCYADLRRVGTYDTIS